MKKSFILPFIPILMIIALFPALPFAGNRTTTYNVPLQKVKNKDHNQQLDYDGRRCPSHPIICTIQDDGIICDISTEDIISYEIWTNDINENVCLAYFNNDIDFSQYLFSLSGNYQIRITTEYYYFIGYISTF